MLKHFKTISIAVFLLIFNGNNYGQSKTISVDHFDEVIISPHIEVVFQEGNEESIEIESLKLPIDKFNVEVKRKTLHLYLHGAKITTPNKKVKKESWTYKESIYKGTQAKVIVTYKNVNTYALRGEERIVFKSPIQQESVFFKIYGESEIHLKDITVQDFKATIYGESILGIEKGNVGKQKYTVYGEAEINALNVTSNETKITAYGDGNFQFNVSNKLKVTSFGEPTVRYKGNANINKGLIIGEARIEKLSK